MAPLHGFKPKIWYAYNLRILQGILDTLPETKMAPENNPLQKEIPIGNHHF